MNWSIRGTGAQAFTAATPADLLRDMAAFVDEWTENGASDSQFVADVSMRFGGESVTPWEGVVYTDSTHHVTALFQELTAAYAGDGEEVSYDEFETAFETTGQVVNIGHVNVYVGEA